MIKMEEKIKRLKPKFNFTIFEDENKKQFKICVKCGQKFYKDEFENDWVFATKQVCSYNCMRNKKEGRKKK